MQICYLLLVKEIKENDLFVPLVANQFQSFFPLNLLPHKEQMIFYHYVVISTQIKFMVVGMAVKVADYVFMSPSLG